jgi:hypothetical protein
MVTANMRGFRRFSYLFVTGWTQRAYTAVVDRKRDCVVSQPYVATFIETLPELRPWKWTER